MRHNKIKKNSIVIPVRQDSLFLSDTYHVLSLSEKDLISVQLGKLKKEPYGKPVIQSYVFDPAKWEEVGANLWVKENRDMGETITGANEEIKLGKEEGRTMKTAISKLITFEVKNFNDEELTFDAIASTEAVDRDGDIIRANGWKLKDYKKNPVVLWGHDMSLPPVAKATNVRVEGDKLLFTPKFASADIYPFADQLYKLYKEGFLNAFSVRFDPIKYENIPQEDGEAETFFFRPPPREYLKQELLEVSCVTIPANQEALVSRDFQDVLVKGVQMNNYGMLPPDVKIKLFVGDKPVNADPPVNEDDKPAVICGKCGEAVEYEKETEVSMGAIKCPHCDATINQEGKVVLPKEPDNTPEVNDGDKKLSEVLEAVKELTEAIKDSKSTVANNAIEGDEVDAAEELKKAKDNIEKEIEIMKAEQKLKELKAEINRLSE